MTRSKSMNDYERTSERVHMFLVNDSKSMNDYERTSERERVHMFLVNDAFQELCKMKHELKISCPTDYQMRKRSEDKKRSCFSDSLVSNSGSCFSAVTEELPDDSKQEHERLRTHLSTGARPHAFAERRLPRAVRDDATHPTLASPQ